MYKCHIYNLYLMYLHTFQQHFTRETEEEEILQRFCLTLINSPFLNKAVWASEAMKELAGMKSEGLFPPASASQTKKFPCWKVTGSTDVHAAYVFLKRSTLTPRVFFQSDFCFCIISNSRHAQIRGKKIADSNYSLLPTWATDCTNLHANDRIYIPGE